MQKFYYTIFIAFVFMHLSNAQIKWTVKKPFEQKNFIENKGQFFIKDKLKPEEIFYTATIDGVTYYFTKTGYTIQHFTKQKNSEREIEELKEKEGSKEENEKEFQYKTVSQFHLISSAVQSPLGLLRIRLRVRIFLNGGVAFSYNLFL